MADNKAGDTKHVPQDLRIGNDVGLITKGRFSRALRAVLKQSAFNPSLGSNATRNSDGVTSHKQDWSLASFLRAVAMLRTTQDSSASIIKNNSAFTSSITDHPNWPAGQDGSLGTSRLAEALRDAIKLREQTGGKDNFLGLRHALFSILVPAKPEEQLALYQMIAEAGSDPKKMAQDIADFCRQAMELGEDQQPIEKKQVWENTIDSRLPRVLALDLQLQRSEEIAAARSDDPWAGDIVDRSGAGSEAEAFASMICWKDFKPPIAVGVFGDWGSGKSFFMRLVHDAIQRRCTVKQRAEAAEERQFLDHVVQIRFNAWHYAETNLWASLVDHILTELDNWAQRHSFGNESQTMFNQLETAREQTLKAARGLLEKRRVKNEAEDALKTAETALEEKRKELLEDPRTWVASAWEETWNSAVKPQLQNATQDLGLTDKLPETAEELRQAVALYDPNKGSGVIRDWLHFIARRPWHAALLTFFVLALPTALAALLSWFEASTVGGVVAGVLAPLLAGMTIVSEGLRSAHAKLSDVQLKVQDKIAEKAAEHQKSQTAAAVAVERAEADLAAATQRLKDTETALKKIKRDYLNQEGKGRVLKFVRDRVSAGDYRKQLSFVAEVRRDFDQLSFLMNRKTAPQDSQERLVQHQKQVEALIKEGQKENLWEALEVDRLRATAAPPEPPMQTPVFERIVLYIDDLDRCPPDQVVVVLQAIHLLLAYPLFVVFVAVDVRWLRAALEQEYPQFARQMQATGMPLPEAGAQAEPSDYLEKIFQVPYWVRAMSNANTHDLLADLMKVDFTESDVDHSQSYMPSTNEKTVQGQDAQESDLPEPVAGNANKSETEVPLQAVQLKFSEEEQTFVKTLAAGLDGSPRRALRFINSYRLIKASLPVQRRPMVAQGGCRAILALLAIQVGQLGKIDGEEAYTAVVKQLNENASELLTWVKGHPPSDGCTRLAYILEEFEKAGGTWSDLKDHADLVARFGFNMTG
ncbi:P-loop NTPase fold protein [Roseibium sp. LAB1]